jgi:hypothetical protein
MSDNDTGILFRLGSRFGVLVAAGVFLLSLNQGLEPAVGLVRASFALLALTGLAWLAEQTVRSAPAAPPAEAPEPAREPATEKIQRSA